MVFCANKISNSAKRCNLTGEDKNTLRMIPRPEITIIRSNVYYRVRRWNVPDERVSSFFYCYYSYTPGAAEVSANGKTHVLGPDRFIIIPAELPHKLKQNAPFDHMFMHFVANTPYNRLKDIISIDSSAFLGLLKSTLDSEKSCLALYSLLYALLLQIPQESMNDGLAKDSEMEKAMLMIRATPSHPLSLEKLANQLHMSVSSLSHRFKKAVGMSPAQYSLQFRLEYALIHLADVNAPDMDTIAEMCGFSNRYHFSKQFKKEYNISPGKMRRNLLNSKSNI